MKTDYDVIMVNLFPSEKSGVKLHYLIKAPEKERMMQVLGLPSMSPVVIHTKKIDE